MLNPEKDGYVYYYTRGLSMWPTFIPHDILRTVRISSSELEPGDIVVLPERNGKQIIHRILSRKKVSEESLLLFTAGDRSNEDPPTRIGKEEDILIVNGVLRNRKWRVPRRKLFSISSRLPNLLVKLHCGIVKKFFW